MEEFKTYFKTVETKVKHKTSKKKVSRSALIRKLDTLVSLKVRSRGRCEWCGKSENLQCAHIISRTYLATRFLEDNCMCLCSGCHLKWHKEPVQAVRFLESKWPGRYDRVDKIRKSDIKYSTTDLQDLYVTYGEWNNLN